MNADWAPSGRQPSHQARIHLSPCFIITQPENLIGYSFHRPTEGGRLSQPRYSSKEVQPVYNTRLSSLYIAVTVAMHNCQRWDSNLSFVTSQSGIGVISGEVKPKLVDPHFLEWGSGPPLYKYTSSLVPPFFRLQSGMLPPTRPSFVIFVITVVSFKL